jgi:hypothetical protein
VVAATIALLEQGSWPWCHAIQVQARAKHASHIFSNSGQRRQCVRRAYHDWICKVAALYIAGGSLGNARYYLPGELVRFVAGGGDLDSDEQEPDWVAGALADCPEDHVYPIGQQPFLGIQRVDSLAYQHRDFSRESGVKAPSWARY